jgi:hypothetical protein
MYRFSELELLLLHRMQHKVIPDSGQTKLFEGQEN